LYNEEVKRRIEVNGSWAYNLAKQKIKFAGHLLRRFAGCLHQLIIEGLVEGRRCKGR